MFQLLKYFDNFKNFTSHSISMLASTRKLGSKGSTLSKSNLDMMKNSSHRGEYPAMHSNGPLPQVSKSSNQLKPGLLHSLPILSHPWQSIGMDFVGPFPVCQGYDYLWVIICRFTNQSHLIPITVRTKTNELAWYYIRNIVRLHGMPESIVSDRDSKFTARFWRELHRALGTKLLMSTSFHPQTDGYSKRVIHSIGQILRSVVSPDQNDWVPRIPLTEFTLNSSINNSSGFAPFELSYEYMPRLAPFPTHDIKYHGVEEFTQ